MVQSGARYWNVGYLDAGLGAVMEGSILPESSSNGRRHMPPDRTWKGPRVQKIPETKDMDRQIRSEKAPGCSDRVTSNSLTAIGTNCGLAKWQVAQLRTPG